MPKASGNHLNIATKVPAHKLAALHIHTRFSNHLVVEDCPQSNRDEECGWDNLHRPGEAVPGCLSRDVPSHIRDQQHVDIYLGVRPLNSCPIGVKHSSVGHLDGHSRVQGHL